MFSSFSFHSRLLLSSVAIFLIAGVVWLLVGQYYSSNLQRESQIQEVTSQSYLYFVEARLAQRDFILGDLQEEGFYKNQETENLKEYRQKISQLEQSLADLLTLKKSEASGGEVKEIQEQLKSYEGQMVLIKKKYRTLGFQDWGLAGTWKKERETLEKVFQDLKKQDLLLELIHIRRTEKNFLLRGKQQYIDELQSILKGLKEKVKSLPLERQGDAQRTLQNYEEAFQKYRIILGEIGGNENTGLRGQLSLIASKLAKGTEKIRREANLQAQQALSALNFSRIILLLSTFVLATTLFYLMSSSLSGPILRLREVLSLSVAQIASTISQISSSAAETASAVSETASTVEEVKQTAHTSSQRATYVADLSKKAVDISLTGKKAVEKTTLGMKEIQEQMESLGDSILKLSEQSQSIGEIISTVKDLAEQSNLLAVNASIEAAKAGEHGRGFAVVAQEIRLLADQSKEATAHVRNILNDIQKATNSAVLSTEQGNKAVKAGSKQVLESGESLDSLARAVQEASQAAFVILSSSKEQMVGMEQISTAMGNVKEASAQNRETMGQLKEASENLKELGDKLKKLIEGDRI